MTAVNCTGLPKRNLTAWPAFVLRQERWRSSPVGRRNAARRRRPPLPVAEALDDPRCSRFTVDAAQSMMDMMFAVQFIREIAGHQEPGIIRTITFEADDIHSAITRTPFRIRGSLGHEEVRDLSGWAQTRIDGAYLLR